MIKALGKNGDGRALVMLGLSGENMTRLMAGEPIAIDMQAEFTGTEVPALHIVLVGGRDENTILTNLREQGLLQ